MLAALTPWHLLLSPHDVGPHQPIETDLVPVVKESWYQTRWLIINVFKENCSEARRGISRLRMRSHWPGALTFHGEAEVGGSWVWVQPELCKKTLSQKQPFQQQLRSYRAVALSHGHLALTMDSELGPSNTACDICFKNKSIPEIFFSQGQPITPNPSKLRCGKRREKSWW